MTRKFTEQEIVRREKFADFKAQGFSLNEAFQPNTTSVDLEAKFANIEKQDLEDNHQDGFSIAGRIMMIRDQGKAVFLAIKDPKGTTQAYVREDELSPEMWNVMKFIDIGDIVGITGRMMKTQTGQVTVRAKEFFLMTKALRPLPEKFHGLTDVEEIYRRRYVDLIMNDSSKETFLNRSKIITGMRRILDEENFIEVETPILNATLGGAAAQPFVTHHNALDMEFKLRIAPELFLKRLIVGGFDKVFEIGRLFRNEGISIKHNPEFTSVEVYQAYASEKEMMLLTEKIISKLAVEVRGTTEFEYQGKQISLKAPFKKIEMVDLIKEVTGVDFNEVKTFEEAKEIAKAHNVELQKHHNSIGYVINEFYEQKCEETITNPTFVTGYPVEVSPLAKARAGSDTITDRFELFCLGREYANGYAELNDADDQYDRFNKQIESGKAGNEEATEMDIDFVESLEYGMPPTGGLGIGIDRLVMLLTDARSIRDVILFPHQKNRN